MFTTAANGTTPAFQNILMGGTGLLAGKAIHTLHRHEKQPFPMQLVQMDTDPSSAEYVEHCIALPLTAPKLQSLMANPALFGDAAEAILKSHGRLLDPEDVENGSRSIRLLTQLSVIYHIDDIRRQLRDAILDLYKQGGFRSILPCFISSSGGGAGSALQILMAQYLRNPEFRARLLEGLPDEVLLTPLAFVVEPYSYTDNHRNSQANMVLANSYAFRIESARLDAQRAFKYVFHMGLANSAGAVLDTPDLVSNVLGACVYHVQRHWKQIKPQLVNNVDINKIIRHYQGSDSLSAPADSHWASLAGNEQGGRANGQTQPHAK